MSKDLQTTTALKPEERALLLNDLSKLTPDQRTDLYVKVCESVGLNPLTQPFQYIMLNNKLCLYAAKNCTDQLRHIHNVSLKIVSREKHSGLYVVTAQATLPNGRYDESIAAVDLTDKQGKELKGDMLSNLIMKCETKAKRRVTLSINGLSYLDEAEVETIKDAKVVDVAALVPANPGVESPPMPDYDNHSQETDFSEQLPDFDAALDSYRIPFGKYMNQKLSQITKADLLGHVKKMEEQVIKRGIPPNPIVQEFLNNANAYLSL